MRRSSSSRLPIFFTLLSMLVAPMVWCVIRPDDQRRIAPNVAASAVHAAPYVDEDGEEQAKRKDNPPPTGDDEDGSRRREREAWFEDRHRAAPGVSWRDIERENAARQVRKRNRLAGLRFPSAGAGAMATGSWLEIGSRNQAGRMHSARYSSDGQRLYAGSAAGGVWRASDLDGSNWEPLGDNLYGGAFELAILPGALPGEPDVIVRGSSDLWVSRDEGQSWTVPLGLPNNLRGVRRLLTTSDGSGALYAVLQEVIGIATHFGVFRSVDTAQTFTKVLDLGTSAGDLWIPRDGGSSLYALSGRTVLRSVDQGQSWNSVGSLPSSVSGGELDGSEAGAPRLWVVGRIGGARKLYRSDDAGVSWSFKTDVTDYWGSIGASIIDPDRFAWGGVEVHRTTDGGNTFQIVSSWGEYYGNPAGKLHADVPGIEVLPDGAGGETWYVATDGGLFRSRDGLMTVENLSLEGLSVSQYYSTHTSSVNSDHVLAGSQDQGYQRASAPPPGLDHRLDFKQLISGDYGHLTSGDGTHGYVYSVYPGFVLIQIGESSAQLATTDFPPSESYGWLPTVTADPLDNRSFFFCASKLYRYTRVGLTLAWSRTQWSSQSFAASPGEYLSALTFSPIDPQRAYAATSGGRLFYSNDHGVTWHLSSGTGPPPHYFYGTALLASSLDVNTVTVAGSGYSNPAVYRSTDGGQTFAPWAEGLPQTLVYCLGEAPDGSGAVVAGTEHSAYRREASGGSWLDITANAAPLNTYWSVEDVPTQNVMRFGTYGRGIWDYPVGPRCFYEPYGVEAAAANVLSLDSMSSTQIGTTHVIRVSGGQPIASGALIVSLNSAWVPAFGGTLLVDLGASFSIPFALNLFGQRDISIPIPANASLVGLTLYGQAAALDANQSKGWAFSNGIRGVLCQ
ncbi:MAG: hypothetical protein RL885_30875 [Planctomycetota bacterium]